MGKSRIFLYPEGDPDLSQNLMGFKLDRDPFSELFLGRYKYLRNHADRETVNYEKNAPMA